MTGVPPRIQGKFRTVTKIEVMIIIKGERKIMKLHVRAELSVEIEVSWFGSLIQKYF